MTMTILERYDVTALIGLPVIVLHSAWEIVETKEDGESQTRVHVPDPETLAAAATILRCLMPRRLRGAEIRAIRKILGMTARDLSEAMGQYTAAETISRWETDKVAPGGYSEKLLRLTACELLKARAPDIEYDAQDLIRTPVVDIDRASPMTIDPRIEMRRVRVQKPDLTVDASWVETKLAA